MKSLKKILAFVLSMVLVAGISVSGTMAFLQEADADVNVMSLGNVKIKQHEYEREVDADGNYVPDATYGYKLKDFTQGKPLLPATELDANGNPYNFGAGDYDTTRVKMSQVGSHGSMDVFVNKNAQDKFVTVENTGKSDAYVRTIIAFELGSLTEARFDEVIRTSSFMYGQGVWNVTDIGTVVIDGTNYFVVEYIYNGAKSLGGVHENGVLPAGDTTYPNLAQVYMTASATNEDVEKIDGNKNGTYEILVVSQAVQVEGFADAETALNAGFGDITTTNHPWTEGAPVVVEDADELVEALESGKDVVLNDNIKIDPASMSNAYGTTGINVKNGQTIYGNGNTLDIKGAGGTWDSGINTTGGLIKDLTVTGSFRGIFINHNSDHSEPVVLENVTIDGTTYTISCDQGKNQNFEAFDSTFNGWTSYAATIGNARFENCKFGRGGGYAYCRPYAPTEFVGCEFEAGYTLDARATVIFTDCTIGGVPLTSENLDELVTSDTYVTIK